MTRSRPILVAALALVLAANALAPLRAQTTMRGTPQAGRLLYHSTAASTNGLACISCHADFDEERLGDGLIRAGHPLINAAERQTFWGQDKEDPDRYSNIAKAAVVCIEMFMLNPEKLSAQQAMNLQAYLQTLTKRPLGTPLALAAAADKTGRYAGLEGGDRIVGRRLFHAACHACHPNGNAGIAPLPISRGKPAAYYARSVREGNGLGAVLSGVDVNAYDPEGGQFMPFFGADRLSQGQLRDIIAFLRSLPPAPGP